MKKVLIVLVTVFIVTFFIFRSQIKKATEELDYGIAPGMKFKGITFGDTSLEIPFWVNNPTNFNLTISGLELDVFVNNIFAGRVKVDRVYQIKKLQKSIIPLSVKLDNVNAMNVLINVSNFISQENWRDKIKISFRGFTRLESGIVYLSNVPISADGSYKYWMG
jgi:LEA14-like dessication related protein